MALNKQQVGKCGELLVQYELLRQGIESAPMTTDYGIDLLAFDPETHKAVSIQVKASGRHEDSTSRWVEWNMPEECIADYVAVVDIERDMIWLFTKNEFNSITTSTGGDGRRLWWYVPGHKPPTSRLTREEKDFVGNKIDAVISTLFPTSALTFWCQGAMVET